MKDASHEVQFTFAQLSRVHSLGKRRLKRWIDKRYFVPSLTVVRGSRRTYTIDDVAVLWLTAFLYDCGLDLPRTDVAWHARKLRGIQADQCLVVADEDAAEFWDTDVDDDEDDGFGRLTYAGLLPKSLASTIIRNVEGYGSFRVVSLPDVAGKAWSKAKRNALDRFELVVEKRHRFRKPKRPTAEVLPFDPSIRATPSTSRLI